MFWLRGLIGANPSILNISKYSVDTPESQLFGGLGSTAYFVLRLRAFSRCNGGKTGERIRNYMCIIKQRYAPEIFDRYFSEVYDASKNNLIRLAIFDHRTNGYDGSFACRTAFGFARVLTPHIGFIHWHIAVQSLAGVSLKHDLSKLEFQRQAGGLKDTKPAHQIYDRNSLL